MEAVAIGKVTVLICDDDALARRALRLLLADPEIEVIGACESEAECMQHVRQEPPQVAIIDLQLSGDRRAGVQLIRQIRTVSPATLCLVLTATDSQGELLPEAFLAGAHGFHRKGYVSGEDLPQMVKRLVAGEWEFDPELAKILLRMVVEGPAPSDPQWDTRTCLLPSEYDVLQLLADGLSARGIADRLSMPPRAVQTHIRNITGKYHLGTSPSMQLCSIRS